MVFLTGGGLTPRTTPVIQAHPAMGVLAQPLSMRLPVVAKFQRWAADNGCFTAGDKFDEPRWMAWLSSLAELPGCFFATAPDVVGDATATWRRSEPLIPRIRALGFKAALVAQDGLESMAIPWNDFDAIFIGGSTRWKLSRHARAVVVEAKRRGMWTHMGRVNSLERLRIAADMGCDSVDGNYITFGPDANLPTVLEWLKVLESDKQQGVFL